MNNLYVIATPIGNLEDLSLRSIRLLKSLPIIFCEDTRQTIKLFNYLELQSPKLISLHGYNEEARIPRVLNELQQTDVGLVCDGGTPLWSDPGVRLVQAVICKGYKVVPIPGPNAMTTLLSAAGIPTAKVYFTGFLSPKTIKQFNQLQALDVINDATIVVYESPYRINKLLENIQKWRGNEQIIAIGRELTKKYEEIITGKISDILDKSITPKGEFVIAIAPEKFTLAQESTKK